MVSSPLELRKLDRPQSGALHQRSHAEDATKALHGGGEREAHGWVKGVHRDKLFLRGAIFR